MIKPQQSFNKHARVALLPRGSHGQRLCDVTKRRIVARMYVVGTPLFWRMQCVKSVLSDTAFSANRAMYVPLRAKIREKDD